MMVQCQRYRATYSHFTLDGRSGESAEVQETAPTRRNELPGSFINCKMALVVHAITGLPIKGMYSQFTLKPIH